ncbi:hypothetical protein GALL_553770 [mine drainage metagenome]|uniref:Uncharacterized protein n=1 Tax=mine drainage metagenome TaxID=410659 RepID=A0A1J5PHQ1_9ZZZZ
MERVLQILGDGPGLPPEAQDALVQIAPREVLAERFHHGHRVGVVEAHLVQLERERTLHVGGVGIHVRNGDKAGDGIQRKGPVGADEARAKFDGGDMPLSRGPKAQDESQRARRNPVLIRVGHDGGIEKRRGFQGVLPGKECADEQPAGLRQGALREDVGRHSFEVRQQGGFEVEVPAVEFPEHGRQIPGGVRLAQGEGPANDGGDALDVRRNEGPQDDAGALGNERHAEMAKPDGGHRSLLAEAAIECSGKFISARESWKASVDSAPWFSLTRSW